MTTTKRRESTIRDLAGTEATVRGLGPAPHERQLQAVDTGELQAERARQCLAALVLSVITQHGADEAESLLERARVSLEYAEAWRRVDGEARAPATATEAFGAAAFVLADQLLRGRP